MESQAKIKLLDKLLIPTGDLKDRDSSDIVFISWKHQVERTLESVFGKDSTELNLFSDLRFFYFSSTLLDYRDSMQDKKAYRDALELTILNIKKYIEEIRDQINDNTEQNNGMAVGENTSEKNKIFISHSSKDEKYVKPFVEYVLRLGLDIDSSRIFCTSVNGHGITVGEYIPDSIRTEIHKAGIVLLFLSKNYKNSEICLNEMGAAWVLLEKTQVIPILLPDLDFNWLGILDMHRIVLKINNKAAVEKLINDNRTHFNPNFNLVKLNNQIDEFIKKIGSFERVSESIDEAEVEKVSEWQECFTNNLSIFDEVLRKTILDKGDGIYRVKNDRTRAKVLKELGMCSSAFLQRLWYKFSHGDCYVEKFIQLPSGNWLFSGGNWEVKVVDMWVSKSPENQNEFILIQIEAFGDSGDVDHPKPVQADQGIPVYVDHPYRLMLTR